MCNTDLNLIIKKHSKLIRLANNILHESDNYKLLLEDIKKHLNLISKLTVNFSEDIDFEALIVCAYWKDIGKVYSDKNIKNISIMMFYKETLYLKYKRDFIQKCLTILEQCNIENLQMLIESKILKDAEYLTNICDNNWLININNCSNFDNRLATLLSIRNTKLNLKPSKQILDNEIHSVANKLISIIV